MKTPTATPDDQGQFAPAHGWAMFPWNEESARAGRWVRWPVTADRYTEPRIVDVGYDDRMKAWVWRSARGWLKCTDAEIWEAVWWAGPIELPKAPIAESSPNDRKLSDRRSWRGLCAVGVALLVGMEAQAVTAEPVRCSAWLGVMVVGVRAMNFHAASSAVRLLCSPGSIGNVCTLGQDNANPDPQLPSGILGPWLCMSGKNSPLSLGDSIIRVQEQTRTDRETALTSFPALARGGRDEDKRPKPPIGIPAAIISSIVTAVVHFGLRARCAAKMGLKPSDIPARQNIEIDLSALLLGLCAGVLAAIVEVSLRCL